MTRCIDPSGYSEGHELRTDRVLSLFGILESCRNRQVDATDSIFDIGCGPKRDLPNFWNLTFSKILQPGMIYPQITGIDLEPDVEPVLPNKFAYLQADINDWPVPNDFRNKFSLVTSVYSWHWIMGGCDSETAQVRASLLYGKVDELLQPDGRFAIQHLYSDDTMPEITRIAIEALRTSGISQLNGITLGEYKDRRAKAWKIPKTLPEVARSFSEFKESNPLTNLQSEYLAGATSWHWIDVKTVWSFWRSVNLKRFFGDLSLKDREALEKAFAQTLNEKTLKELRLCSKRDGETLYVRITVKSAHEIIRKGNVAGKYRSSVILRPDLPNQVRARLAEQISSIERNEPWFGLEGTVISDGSSHDPQTEPLLDVLKPILTCVDDTIARVFSINLRQVSTTDGSNLGRMRNVGPTNADAERIQADGQWLRQLKTKGVPTISEIVLSTLDNPPEVVVFIGDHWNNYRDWYYFTQTSLANSKTGSRPSVVVLWVSAKNPTKLEPFEPGNVVYADYLWEIAGWHENSNIVDFLHFLLGQLRDDVKSTFLATSNLSIEGDSKRRDSVSITLFQNLQQSRTASQFPEIADCFLLIDALQELALIGERIKSRQQGVKSLISASSHEQKQVVDFIFGRLFNQRFANWFNLNDQPIPIVGRMGVINVYNEYKPQIEELRIIPSNTMLNAARSFFGLWSGTRDFLQDHLFGERETISLLEAINKWSIDQAVGIAALTDIRTRDMEGFSDWLGLRDEWRNALAIRAKQFSCKDMAANKLWIRKPTQDEIAIRTKQIWFFRAILAMLTNALKNCSGGKEIICRTEYDPNRNKIQISVINPIDDLNRKFPKTDGTEAVLRLCAEGFGGRSPVTIRFESCDSNGAKRPDCPQTHWVSEAVFPCGVEIDGSTWIFH